jgi:hypothetical protein
MTARQHSAGQLRDLAERLESGDLCTFNAREPEWAAVLRDLALVVECATDQATLDAVTARIMRIALGAMMRYLPKVFGPPEDLDAVLADPARVAAMAHKICEMRDGDISGEHLAVLLDSANGRTLQ